MATLLVLGLLSFAAGVWFVASPTRSGRYLARLPFGPTIIRTLGIRWTIWLCAVGYWIIGAMMIATAAFQ